MSKAIIKVQTLDFHWETLDPFLFCAFHADKFPKGNAELGPVASLDGRNIGADFKIKDGWRMYHGDKIPGFPAHPHRGFETITIVQEGFVDHADSLGAAGRYGNGDVQWLTTGKGVQHSEMFPLINQDADNPLLLFQVWLNLPAKQKMVEPCFSMFWHENIPVFESKDDMGNAIKVKVIAGVLQGVSALPPPPDSWAANPHSEIAVWLIELAPGACWKIPAAHAGLNRRLYFFEGESVLCEGEEVKVKHAVTLNSAVSVNLENSSRPAKFLLLQGKPLNEPVAQHGPFVMNTREQLQQAFDDYHRDQFGGWSWERRDQVHGINQGRFAKNSNGSVEEPVEKNQI